MIYNIKRLDEDTIQHEIIVGKKVNILGKEVGISKLENLQSHLQDWVNQRKQIFKITKVTNDLGVKLK